jgi:hypothetical protein
MAADIRITIRERTCRQCITASRSTDIFRNGVHRPDPAGRAGSTPSPRRASRRPEFQSALDTEKGPVALASIRDEVG